MSKDKINIIAVKNGVPQGYIKAISYDRGTFALTKEQKNARGYTNVDEVHSDIDFLTKYSYVKGYTFMYNR